MKIEVDDGTYVSYGQMQRTFYTVLRLPLSELPVWARNKPLIPLAHGEVAQFTSAQLRARPGSSQGRNIYPTHHALDTMALATMHRKAWTTAAATPCPRCGRSIVSSLCPPTVCPVYAINLADIPFGLLVAAHFLANIPWEK